VRYFLNRFLQLLLVFVIVTFTVLVIMRMGANSPEDLAIKLAGRPLSPEESSALISKYSLDSNYVVQYLNWLKNLVFHFDLGYSPQANMPVEELLKPRVWTTILLGLYANFFGLLIAIPLAVHQAYRRDRLFDKAGSMATFIAVGIPGIVLGVFLKLLFVVHWQIFPSIGDKVYPWEDLHDHVMNFFLPAVTLTIPIAAIYARLLRADMVMTLQSDFITLASAKGVPPGRVVWKHGLRNSLFSLVTALGTQLGALLGSAVLVETLFDLDGLGSQLVVSVLGRDLFTVQSFVAIIVLIVVTVNLMVDLSYALIDPRIRQARALG
jgi:peptide/nickel transport system permease protein